MPTAAKTRVAEMGSYDKEIVIAGLLCSYAVYSMPFFFLWLTANMHMNFLFFRGFEMEAADSINPLTKRAHPCLLVCTLKMYSTTHRRTHTYTPIIMTMDSGWQPMNILLVATFIPAAAHQNLLSGSN